MIKLHKFRHQFFFPLGMHYTKANNASGGFSTFSRAAQKDLAYQYLYQVLVDTNVVNQDVTAQTQCLITLKQYMCKSFP